MVPWTNTYKHTPIMKMLLLFSLVRASLKKKKKKKKKLCT